MPSATLRKWGGAVAVSLPKKVLALLGLEAGSEVDVRAENGNIVLSPARPAFELTQLLREQKQVDRRRGLRTADGDNSWLDNAPQGREML